MVLRSAQAGSDTNGRSIVHRGDYVQVIENTAGPENSELSQMKTNTSRIPPFKVTSRIAFFTGIFLTTSFSACTTSPSPQKTAETPRVIAETQKFIAQNQVNIDISNVIVRETKITTNNGVTSISGTACLAQYNKGVYPIDPTEIYTFYKDICQNMGGDWSYPYCGKNNNRVLFTADFRKRDLRGRMQMDCTGRHEFEVNDYSNVTDDPINITYSNDMMLNRLKLQEAEESLRRAQSMKASHISRMQAAKIGAQVCDTRYKSGWVAYVEGVSENRLQVRIAGTTTGMIINREPYRPQQIHWVDMADWEYC
jgi:hypothetical protein